MGKGLWGIGARPRRRLKEARCGVPPRIVKRFPLPFSTLYNERFSAGIFELAWAPTWLGVATPADGLRPEGFPRDFFALLGGKLFFSDFPPPALVSFLLIWFPALFFVERRQGRVGSPRPLPFFLQLTFPLSPVLEAPVWIDFRAWSQWVFVWILKLAVPFPLFPPVETRFISPPST